MLKNCFDIAETIDCRLLQRIDRIMDMLNLMMTTDVAGNPCWMKPGRVDSSGFSENYGLHGIRSETSQVAITQASMGICERTF